MLGTRVQGLRRAVEKAQPDPGANVELQLPVVGILVFSCEPLGLNKALSCFGEDGIAATEQRCGRLGASQTGSVG
jgi:hypothetical protein